MMLCVRVGGTGVASSGAVSSTVVDVASGAGVGVAAAGGAVGMGVGTTVGSGVVGPGVVGLGVAGAVRSVVGAAVGASQAAGSAVGDAGATVVAGTEVGVGSDPHATARSASTTTASTPTIIRVRFIRGVAPSLGIKRPAAPPAPPPAAPPERGRGSNSRNQARPHGRKPHSWGPRRALRRCLSPAPDAPCGRP